MLGLRQNTGNGIWKWARRFARGRGVVVACLSLKLYAWMSLSPEFGSVPWILCLWIDYLRRRD